MSTHIIFLTKIEQIKRKNFIYCTYQMGCLKLTYREHESPLRVIYRKGLLKGKSVQRCLSTDPLAADYMAWSTYNYVMGNPIMFIDPTGMGAEWVDKGDGTYTAEKGDSAATLAEDANISPEEANAIVEAQLGKNYIGKDGKLKSDVEIDDIVWISKKVKKTKQLLENNSSDVIISVNNSIADSSEPNQATTGEDAIARSLSTYGGAISHAADIHQKLILDKGKMVNLNQLKKGKLQLVNTHRINGGANINRYVNSSKYIKGTKMIGTKLPLINIGSLLYDYSLAYKYGRPAYAVRGTVSFAAGYIPYVGIGVSIGIASMPLEVFEGPSDFRGGGVCFVEGTKIWTNNGLVCIENLSLNDKVYSVNLENDSLELQNIIFQNISRSDTIIKIIISDSIIVESTIEHPFYVENIGWTPANKLLVGDYLKNGTKSNIRVLKILIEIRENTKIFNIQVMNNNNYLVSRNRILVHNESYLPIFEKKDENEE